MPGVGTGFQPAGQPLKKCAAQKDQSAWFSDPFSPTGLGLLALPYRFGVAVVFPHMRTLSKRSPER